MFKNYFKSAWRGIVNSKGYAVINILGLAIGITACILIGLFVSNEMSFDKNVPGYAHIYRLNEYMHYDGTDPKLSASIGPPIAPFLKNNHGEIENYTRVLPATPFIYPSITLEYGDKKIKTNQMVCTDTTFADMFGANIIEGNKSDFIRTQNSIVLTQSMAHKFFGNDLAVNKTMTLRENDTLTHVVTVSNVIKDFPANSHLQFDGLLPVPHQFEKGFLGDNYGVVLGPSYLQLKPGVDISTLQEKLTSTIHAKNKFIDMRLQPFSEIHSGSTDISYDDLNFKKINGKYIRVFIIIALAIFIIACCNFINLTIAVAAYRGKEIGMKKMMGASRLQIIVQIVSEALLSTTIAIITSFILSIVFLPYLDNILGRQLPVSSLYQWPFVGVYLLALLITTLLAGLYPAILISSAKINQALKAKVLFGGSRTRLRNILVTGQFAIAVIFIVSLIVFLKQLKFIQEKDLGYSYSQVIRVPLDIANASKLDMFRSELLKIKGVEDITHGYMELGAPGLSFGINYISPSGKDVHVTADFENAAPNYVHFFGMKIITGHDFTQDNPGNEYLINESLAKMIGYKDPVGKTIHLTSFPNGKIVGVVKDFNYSSLHIKIEPLLISSINGVSSWQSQLYIKVSAAEISSTLKKVGSTLKTISGDSNIELQFLDEHFKKVYKSEEQATTMIAIIGTLAIFIACFGLLSLAAFIIVKRAKEVSIRKVLGASVSNIVGTLSKEFVRLVIIAFIIATPVAYWLANSWLQDFAYRIEIHWWIFALAGTFAVGIAFLTISFLAVKAAMANPVKSLRNE